MGFGVEEDGTTGGKHVPFWGAIPGWTFRQQPIRKMHPILSVDSGMQLPLEAST